MEYTQLIELLKDADAEAVMTTAILEDATDAIEDLQARVTTLQYEVDAIESIKVERDALQALVKELEDRLECDRAILEARTKSMNAALAKLKELEAQEPVAWAHKGPLGYAFGEKQNEAYSIPLYCAPMTMDSNFIQIPVAYQYAYPDGQWRCSYGDPINGSRPITSRALYARKDGK